MAALSGPVAEQSFVGYPRDARAMMWGSSWKADRAKAEGHLRRSSMARTLGDAALKAAQLFTEYGRRSSGSRRLSSSMARRQDRGVDVLRTLYRIQLGHSLGRPALTH